jgi:hypothetical protein
MEKINTILREKVTTYMSPEEHLPLVQECDALTQVGMLKRSNCRAHSCFLGKQQSLQDEVQTRLNLNLAEDESEVVNAKSLKKKKKNFSVFSLQQLQKEKNLHLALSSPTGQFLSASEGLFGLTGTWYAVACVSSAWGLVMGGGYTCRMTAQYTLSLLILLWLGYSCPELLRRTDQSLHTSITSKEQITRINDLLTSGQRDVAACLLHRHKLGFPYCEWG